MCPVTQHRNTGPASRPAARTDARRPDNEPPPTLFDRPRPEPPDGRDPPAPPPGTYLTSLYRLDRVAPTLAGLRTVLNDRYLRENRFEIEERTVAQAPALLVHGTVARERAEWCDVLTTLTGQEVALGYSSGGGALLIAVDDRVYALAYGTLGRHLVDQGHIDPGFGIAFAVRALVPDEIKQVRRRVLGVSGRIDRNLVAGGQPIRMYGIDKWGEIVGQVCGPTMNPNLTACRRSPSATDRTRTRRPTRVEGSDALRIHLGTSPDDLVADLREIDRVCQRESPLADLEFITQIRPVPPTDPRLPDLHEQLDRRLALADPPDLALAVPGELLDTIEQVRSYRIRVPKSGRRATLMTDLTLADLLDLAHRVPDGERLTALRNGRITLHADAAGAEEIGSAAASRWLTAQVAAGTSHLLLQDGHWYEIGDRHREQLRQEIEQILAGPASVTLPPWPAGEDERSYNDRVAKSGLGLVLLDRRLLRTAQHHRGIEACDLLGPDGELIHVKRADGSAPLSHLFAQGQVSADALTYQADARQALVRMVGSHRIGPAFRPRKVVYAIALGAGRTLTVDSLFTFAQVALYRAMKALRNEGIEVEVIEIPAG
ncbi:TIGR04141 family sporadically distributed protein [Solwaraspora sp. WMMD1047]|uniref:DUF6119 family protein n=1 Tax=Solwaraspora sp. WMMD1047 TaxID=3016102 RepID=UPI002417CC3D|nr:DUF6119 family protein [Solwaraspora sp. WMMD1047]MDG4830455.1 TIGR04141 family sporadically distributed protein [Solwaraspora sp. WMMD1047]